MASASEEAELVRQDQTLVTASINARADLSAAAVATNAAEKKR